MRLKVETGGHTASIIFRLAPKLAPKMILETAFINSEIKWFEINRRQAKPMNEYVGASIIKFEDNDIVQLMSSGGSCDDGKFQTSPSACRVHCNDNNDEK